MNRKSTALALLASTLLFASCAKPPMCSAYKVGKIKPLKEQTFLTDKKRK